MSLFHDSQYEIDYPRETSVERFGDLELRVERLKNLERTIDQVFDYLSKVGKPELLEKLCPYFGIVWPSARALTHQLSRTPDFELMNKKILELGCGLAIPSLSLAKRGIPVTATDYHPEVARFLEWNLQGNAVSNNLLRYIEHNWEDESGQQSPELHSTLWDRVMGSDILYEARYAETLAQRIATLLRRTADARAWIADPGRPYIQRFTDCMKEHGFEETLETMKVHDQPEPKEIFLLEFRWSERTLSESA